MVLNIVHTLALAMALGFLSIHAVKAVEDYSTDTEITDPEDTSNVLPDPDDSKVYSLNSDDDDDFD